MKSWLQHNKVEVYLTHNEGNLVFAEKFTNIYKLQYQKMCMLMN